MEIVNKAKQGIDVTDVRVMKKANTGRVMKKAKAFGSRRSVMRGSTDKTSGGLTKSGMRTNLHGKIVSVQASEASKKKYAKLQAWNLATQMARKALGLRGFVAVGGASPEGPALYAKTKDLLASPHVHWPCVD